MDLDLDFQKIIDNVTKIKPLSEKLGLNVDTEVKDTISQILIIYIYTFFLRNNTDKCIEEYVSLLKYLSEYMKSEKYDIQNSIDTENRTNGNNKYFKKFFKNILTEKNIKVIVSYYYNNSEFLKKKVGTYIIMNSECKYLLDIIKSNDDINIQTFKELPFNKKIKMIDIINNIYKKYKKEYYLHPLLIKLIENTDERFNFINKDNDDFINNYLPKYIHIIKDELNRDSNDDEETSDDGDRTGDGTDDGTDDGTYDGFEGGGKDKPRIQRQGSYQKLRIKNSERPNNLTPIDVNRLITIYSTNIQKLDDYMNTFVEIAIANDTSMPPGEEELTKQLQEIMEQIESAQKEAGDTKSLFRSRSHLSASSFKSLPPSSVASSFKSLPPSLVASKQGSTPRPPSPVASRQGSISRPPRPSRFGLSKEEVKGDSEDPEEDPEEDRYGEFHIKKNIKTQTKNKVKLIYINIVLNEIQQLIDEITYHQRNFNFKKNNILDDYEIKRAMNIIDENIIKLRKIEHKLPGMYVYRPSDSSHKEDMEELTKIVAPLIEHFSEIRKKLPGFIKGNNLTRTEISESELHNPDLIKLISELDVNDFNNTSKIMDFISKIAEKNFGNDILDERRICGEIDNEQIDGAQCINIIKKCLSGTNKKECFDEFKQLDLDKDINLKTMDYGLAVSLAKSLGFLDTTVDIALDNISKKENIEISERLKVLFEAIKAKINNVDGVSYTLKSKRVNKIEGIPVRDDGGQTESQTGGGNINNYNNFIMNLDALKKNLTMKGGSNNYIIIKKNLNYLNELLKANNKQIDSSDLRKINLLIDKLEIGEQKLKKINNVIEGLIIAINLRKVDFTNINKPIIYTVLKDLYEKSKDRQEKNLHKVDTLVSLFNGLLPVLGVKFGTP